MTSEIEELKRANALTPMRSDRIFAPEMPWFSTATGAPPASAKRLASVSGQRSLPSTVEPSPSVMESPKVTMAAFEALDNSTEGR